MITKVLRKIKEGLVKPVFAFIDPVRLFLAEQHLSTDSSTNLKSIFLQQDYKRDHYLSRKFSISNIKYICNWSPTYKSVALKVYLQINNK